MLSDENALLIRQPFDFGETCRTDLLYVGEIRCASAPMRADLT
jgi:hypothetical protein